MTFHIPGAPRRLPTILTVEEVGWLIASVRNLLDRAMLMVFYSTGMRNCEMRNPQVKDVDSKSLLIHIQHGKGGRDRYVPLSAKLLRDLAGVLALDEPKTWLFPGAVNNWRDDKPITPKAIWDDCQFAAKRDGIEKRVYAHLLRHSYAMHLLEAEADLRTIQLLGARLDSDHKALPRLQAEVALRRQRPDGCRAG